MWLSPNQPIYLEMVFIHYPEEIVPPNISFFTYIMN